MLGGILFTITLNLLSFVGGPGWEGLAACELIDDVYTVQGTEEVVASDFNDSKQTPQTAVYSDETDYIMLSYEAEDVPAHLSDNPQYTCLQVRSSVGFDDGGWDPEEEED